MHILAKYTSCQCVYELRGLISNIPFHLSIIILMVDYRDGFSPQWFPNSSLANNTVGNFYFSH